MMSSNSINVYLTRSGQFISTNSNEHPSIDRPMELENVIEIFERYETVLHHGFKDKFSDIKAQFDELSLMYGSD
jgi:hypothetical protein